MYELASSPNDFELPRKGTFDFNDEERKLRQKKKGQFSWEDLNRIETRRRAILKRVELPFRRIIFFWDGTCLRALSRDRLIWLTMLLYIGVRIMAWMGVVPGLVQELADTDTGALGGFLSFFLVLFVNQTNSRFYDMYMDSMSCQKYILDIASIVKHTFPRPNALRLVRYLNAAHVAGYTGLSKTYSKESFFDELNQRFNMLTQSEMSRIDELEMEAGSNCCHAIFGWCMREVQVAISSGIIEDRDGTVLREKVLSAQEYMDNLYAYTDQPVAFYYIHFLCLLSALYLPLLALSSAYTAGFGDEGIHLATDFLLFLIVLLQAFFVIGLRLLGQQMIDPYGDDLEDLSVLHYVWSTAESSKKILNAEYPNEINPVDEEEFARKPTTTGSVSTSLDLPELGKNARLV